MFVETTTYDYATLVRAGPALEMSSIGTKHEQKALCPYPTEREKQLRTLAGSTLGDLTKLSVYILQCMVMGTAWVLWMVEQLGTSVAEALRWRKKTKSNYIGMCHGHVLLRAFETPLRKEDREKLSHPTHVGYKFNRRPTRHCPAVDYGTRKASLIPRARLFS